MKDWIIAVVLVVVVGSYVWMRHQRVPAPTTSVPFSRTQDAPISQTATFTRPTSDPKLRQNAAQVVTLPVALTISGEDQSNDFPPGSSVPLLRKTFVLAHVVNVRFELPVHASSGQLRGTYRAFVQQSSVQAASGRSGDPASDVEFLLLSEQQSGAFLDGHPGDALFSAGGAPEQEINFSLPPSLGGPATYHLVFVVRNQSGSTGKRVVQADFRLDF